MSSCSSSSRRLRQALNAEIGAPGSAKMIPNSAARPGAAFKKALQQRVGCCDPRGNVGQCDIHDSGRQDADPPGQQRQEVENPSFRLAMRSTLRFLTVARLLGRPSARRTYRTQPFALPGSGVRIADEARRSPDTCRSGPSSGDIGDQPMFATVGWYDTAAVRYMFCNLVCRQSVEGFFCRCWQASVNMDLAATVQREVLDVVPVAVADGLGLDLPQLIAVGTWMPWCSRPRGLDLGPVTSVIRCVIGVDMTSTMDAKIAPMGSITFPL